MSEKSEKSFIKRSFGSDAKDVKTTISSESYERLRQEAQHKEISDAELVRHIIYDYQKKESSQSKPE